MTEPAHGLVTDTQPAPALHARAATSARNAWRATPLPARILLAFAALATALGVLSYTLSRATPAWWAVAVAPDPDGPQRAERLERAVVSELHKGRAPGEAWTITIDEAHANAWLAHRLPRWLAHRDRRLAANLPELRVRFTPGALRVGAAYDDRVVGATLAIAINEDSLRADLRAARLGRLPLPGALAAAAALDALPATLRADPDTSRALAAVFNSGAHQPNSDAPRPVFRLDDGRHVRIIALTLHDRAAHITCVTERDNGAQPHSPSTP